MTAAVAMLLVGLLLFALGRKHKSEDGAQHCIGVSMIAILFALMLFVLDVKAADPQPPPSGETYVLVRFDVMERLVNLLTQNKAELAALREALRAARQPKECI